MLAIKYFTWREKKIAKIKKNGEFYAYEALQSVFSSSCQPSQIFSPTPDGLGLELLEQAVHPPPHYR